MPNPLQPRRVREDGDNYDAAEIATLECVIERVTFHNAENGYSVVKVSPLEAKGRAKGDVITVLGSFTNPIVGESLRCHGEWVKHPQYGAQFKLHRYETLRPATAAAIEKYLGSGMVKGIGPVMAKRIVDKFGKDALDVIETAPDKLTRISGIGEKRIGMITAAWEEQKEVRAIMLFLQGHGVSPTYAVKIYRTYKERSIEVVEQNPYQLATDIWGIGFKSADKIAQNIGIAPDSAERLQAGLIYVLNQEMDNGGHCFLPEDALIEAACKILSTEQFPIERAPIERALAELVAQERLVAETVEMVGTSDTAIYTPSIHTTEKAVAERINTLLNSPWRSRLKPQEIDAVVAGVPGHDQLSAEQQQSVRRALTEPLMILTGGPGVGKCLVGDSLVLSRRGAQPLETHWGGVEAQPDTFRERIVEVVAKDKIAPTSHAYFGGMRETVRVRTHLGLELEGTPNHRVWAMTEHGPDWVRLDGLTEGMYVAIRRSDDVWSEAGIAPDLAYLLGVISGDGMQACSKTLSITNNDLALLHRCQQIFSAHFGCTGHITPTRKTFDLRAHGTALRHRLIEMGLHICKSEGKVVPAAVLRSSRDAIVNYLAGLFDTDGHIQKRACGHVVFEITLKSVELIRQVQILLLNLGIVSRRAPKTVHYRYRERDVEERTYWRLSVFGEDVDRLMAAIPTRKAVPPQQRICNTNRDIVPLPGGIIRDIFTQPGRRTRREWWKWKREIKGERRPTRARLLHLLDDLEPDARSPQIDALREACRPCYYWDRVVAIQPSAAPVYDLTVPGEESFIANGFVNHNTTTTRAIVAAFEKLGKRLQLASPTGRAAKRLAEVTGREAKTIHRMLEFDPEKRGFKHGPGDPLDLDVLIIDESSMLDLVLTHNTLRAVPDGAQILFVGDVDQLPSVGPGNVLSDLIDSGRVPVARLTQVFRQAAESRIITNAHAINRGRAPDLPPPSAVREGADCVFLEVEEAEEMPQKIAGVVAKSLPRLGFGRDEITVLAPMQRGSVGARNLNEVLQGVLNPPGPDKPEVKRGPIVFRVGDRVMQRVNNYDKNVFNGDVGHILGIDLENQTVGIQYPEGPIEYDFADIDQLVHAFSLTIHKCLREDERVWTTGRGLVAIRDLAPGECIHTGRDGARRVRAKVNTGTKPVVRVTTRSGYRIDVSAEHPILAATREGAPRFVKAEELTPDHFACLSREIVDPRAPVPLPPIRKLEGRRCAPPEVPTVLDEDLAWLLGALVGDGSYRDVRDGTVDFTNQDPEVLCRFRRILESYGLRVCSYQLPNRRATRLYVVSRAFRRWLGDLGLEYATARDKHVPPLLFQAPAAVRAAFLRGLFDTDGSAGTGTCRQCRLVTASERLAREAQELLLSLGMAAKRGTWGRGAFCVAVSGTSLPAFAERVGFTIAYKQERLQEILRSAGAVGKTNNDTIPFEGMLIEAVEEALRERFGRSRGTFGAVGTLWSALRHDRTRMNYRHLRDIVAHLEFAGAAVPSRLRETLAQRFFYDPVVSVERTGEQATMYDIEVEDVHSFVAGGGFVCHNSQGSEYPACIIALHTQHYMMLARNLVYTALTRARKLAVFVGSKRAIMMAVRNKRAVQRNTRLAARLQRLVEDAGTTGRTRGMTSGRDDTPPPALPGRLL